MFRLLRPTPILSAISPLSKVNGLNSTGSQMAIIVEDVIGSIDYDKIKLDSKLTASGIKREGTIISPRSLSPQVLLNPFKPKPRPDLAYPLGPPVNQSKKSDFFQLLNLSPIKNSIMNPYLKSEFTTSMGKIQNRSKNSLGRKSQRLIGKSIRRSRSLGILPYFGKDQAYNGGY